MYGQGLRAISRDCLEDGIGCLGPDERLGVVIVGLNKGSDIGLELIDAAMDAALICLSVSSANQRSTWLSQEALVGVKWRW